MTIASMFVRNRVPALQHEMKGQPTTKLKHIFKSNVEAAFKAGDLPARYHAWKAVFKAFIDLMGPDGALYPSHAKIAEKSQTSERTVWAAMNALEKVGLIRVTARYTYDAEKGKRVRTSNAYEIVLNAAQRAAAIVAAAARKAHEASRRQAAMAARVVSGLFHHLPATDTDDPQSNIFRKREIEPHVPQMSKWDMIDWLNQGSSPL